MKQTGFLSAFQLKLLMAALMLLDHLYYNLFPDKLYVWHCAARVVAPVFAYLMTQSLLYTRNRCAYLMRLWVAAATMLAGNAVLWMVYGDWIPNNIFFSLALSASILVCLERARSAQHGGWYAAACALFLLSLFCEGGYLIPVLGLVFFYLRGRPFVLYGAYAVVSLLFNLPQLLLTQRFPAQLYMVLAILPLLSYNGKRGANSKPARYFFYVFYPVHIWIIFVLEHSV